MLDIKFIRDNAEVVKAAIAKKHIECDLAALLVADNERLEILAKVEELRAKQNEASRAAADPVKRLGLLDSLKLLKEELKNAEEKLSEVMKRWQGLMLQVPNIPDVSVPEGKSDEDNKEIRRSGEPPQFDFEPKSHIDLLNQLGWVDFERGTKVSGFRGYILKGEAVKLVFGLTQFAFDRIVAKGFEPMIAPSLARREPFLGTGYLPQGEEDLYRTQDGQYLSGTAEVAVMGAMMDEVIDPQLLPRKIVAYSPCYRREAGSYGKDTKGLFRVHEFTKIEQVVLCAADHQQSVDWHEALLLNAEEVMQALELPYRVVVNAGGDLGLGQVKKYDLEAWLPAEKKYRETHSISYFHDFQTRRLNIRYRDAEGKFRFAHSLNGTGLAFPRALIALVENRQTAEGKISIPTALQPYLGGNKILG